MSLFEPIQSKHELPDSAVLKTAEEANESSPVDPAEVVAKALDVALILHQQGDLQGAQDLYHHILEFDPENADATHLMGVAAYQQADLDTAEELIQKAMALRPADPVYINNLGTVVRAKGDIKAAIGRFREVLRLKPDFTDAHTNLGVALLEAGRPDEAIAHCRAALRLDKANADAQYNMGNAYRAKGDDQRAIDAYSEALKLRPEFVAAYNNLGAILQSQGHYNEAIICFKEALVHDPHHIAARSNLIYQKQHQCDWSSWQAEVDWMASIVRESKTPLDPFMLLSVPTTAHDQLLAARRWSASTSAPLHQFSLPSRPYQIHERPRIGYLSADFGDHPVGRMAADLLEAHDHTAVELFAYALTTGDGSSRRSRIQNAVEHFSELHAMSLIDTARKIQADDLDVLVDLTGYTLRGKPGLLALRPAPVQVNYLGYPGTMGSPEYDYIIADHTLIPEEQADCFDERVLYLPDSYQPNTSRSGDLPTIVRAALGLPEDAVVLCCFNASYKLNPAVFDSWMRVMARVPSAVLWLLETRLEASAQLRKEAEARGVDGARLIFARRCSEEQHLARLQAADLALDTWPYNAHTTATDALWAGVPMVTLLGSTFAGRVGASLLHTIGLPELVTTSRDDYEALIVRLAGDVDTRTGMRAHLLTEGRRSPLFDAQSYAKHLESLYCEIVAAYHSAQARVAS